MINKSCQLSVVSCQLKKTGSFLVFFILLLTAYFVLPDMHCHAAESKTVITAESLEYEKETSMYNAKGSVKIVDETTTIEADAMKYYENTGDVFASGNVKYSDQNIYLMSEKADYNPKTKKGIFYNAEVSFKKDKFRIAGTVIHKRGENEYSIENARMTSCDGPSPAWCFKGSEADLIVGDRLKSKNTTFNINDIPVMYTPYLWAPVITERKTGLLMPVMGYSKTKGFHYRQPFFWAIDEDKDATFIFDWYSKRGMGKGLEYRYIYPSGNEGAHYLYHLYDSKLDKTFYELKSSHEKRSKDGLSAYLNVNLLNKKIFYREYSIQREERIKRFLESTGEVSLPMDHSRFYLLSQYRIDLKDYSRDTTVVQRLPEFGYTVNPYKLGPTTFNLASSASNFWRKNGVSGQRLDIYPKVMHSFGDKVIISQNLGLRETSYTLYKNEPEGYKNSIQRHLFDYNITASSRLLKKYDRFYHAVEPSLGYTFVPWIKKEQVDTPLFDSIDSYSKQSTISLSIANRIFDKKSEFFTLNMSGSYNAYARQRPFSPLSIAAAISKPIPIRGDISYNTYNGKIESINSDVAWNISKMTFTVGERYNRGSKVMFYDIGATHNHNNLSTEAKLWYDAKGGGVRDTSLRLIYKKQCWGVTMGVVRKPRDEINNRPTDYNVFITFDLLGIGSTGSK